MNKAKINVVTARKQETVVTNLKTKLRNKQNVFLDNQQGLEILGRKGVLTRILTELGDNVSEEGFIDAVNTRIMNENRKETLSFKDLLAD